MISDEELKELLEQVEKPPATEEVAPLKPALKTADSVIEEQRQKDFQAIAQNKEFQELSATINGNDVEARLEKAALVVQGQRQKNALERYKLRIQKRVLREKEKADVYAIKLKNAQARWGYLYQTETVETVDENGNKIEEVRYKSFTTSKFINRYKEFVNWYKNLTAETQKVIWATVKFVIKTGILVAIGFAIYGVVKWLLDSGLLNIVVGQ